MPENEKPVPTKEGNEELRGSVPLGTTAVLLAVGSHSGHGERGDAVQAAAWDYIGERLDGVIERIGEEEFIKLAIRKSVNQRSKKPTVTEADIKNLLQRIRNEQ